MDDFGAPGGQVQISFKFYEILIKNGRFWSSRWPGPNLFKFSLKMDDFGAPGGQIQILFKFY